jgi:hypothetical protein
MEDPMRNFALAVAVVAMLGVFPGGGALAQQGIAWKGGGGWGAGSPYGRLYNPQTVETVSGEVVKVEQVTPMKGMHYGVHAVLKTAGETLSVHLGPGWYIENQEVKIAAGDKLEAKGSRVSIDGKPVLIAAEVKKGDELLVLRDAAGVPVWSGWRRR